MPPWLPPGPVLPPLESASLTSLHAPRLCSVTLGPSLTFHSSKSSECTALGVSCGQWPNPVISGRMPGEHPCPRSLSSVWSDRLHPETVIFRSCPQAAASPGWESLPVPPSLSGFLAPFLTVSRPLGAESVQNPKGILSVFRIFSRLSLSARLHSAF